MKSAVLSCLLMLGLYSCSDISSPGPERKINFSIRYGIGGRNELNTFNNTLTKDLILDGTVTVPFSLTAAELDSIKGTMEKISFFSYPDTFVVVSHDSLLAFVTPYNTYDFKVVSRGITKTLFWNDAIIANDTEAAKLRELIGVIRAIVESKPAYRQLPPARGVYL